MRIATPSAFSSASNPVSFQLPLCGVRREDLWPLSWTIICSRPRSTRVCFVVVSVEDLTWLSCFLGSCRCRRGLYTSLTNVHSLNTLYLRLSIRRPTQCSLLCDLRGSDAGHARITDARGGCILHVRRCGHTAAARPDEKGRLWSVCLACMFAVENLR